MVTLESRYGGKNKEKGIRVRTSVFADIEDLERVLPIFAKSAKYNSLHLNGTGEKIGNFPGHFLITFHEAEGSPDPFEVLMTKQYKCSGSQSPTFYFYDPA